jgi:Ca-activated chloride channel family protein
MLGVLGNLMNGNNCTMVQLGLNSPIAANPDDRPPLNLAVVVDVSGSMNTNGKIDFVRDGLNQLIDGMRDTDQLALITYSDSAQVIRPLGELSLARAELRDLVDGLIAAGSTNLYAGLELGYQQIFADYDSGRQNRVILLSDGVATAGITADDAIMTMSRGYNSDGAGLTTVGLGTDFNAQLMRGLAEQGDGNTYFLENAGAVSEVFQEELSYFTVPVAFDLQLELQAGPHYEFRRAYGSSFWEDTQTGGTLEVPSVFLAHRESDQDVTDDGGRRGGGSALMIELMPTLQQDDGVAATEADVAVVDVSFREPGTDQIVEDQVTVHFPMAPWELPETGFFESPDLSIIQKSFVMLNIYVTFEEASMLFHAGDPAGARAALERVIAGVEDYNEEVQDLDIEFDLQMLSDMRDLMVEQGVQLPGEFEVPVDPWPAD